MEKLTNNHRQVRFHIYRDDLRLSLVEFRFSAVKSAEDSGFYIHFFNLMLVFWLTSEILGCLELELKIQKRNIF
jgi:hypothetical protein